jgi:CRP-like cAMP-binding protein
MPQQPVDVQFLKEIPIFGSLTDTELEAILSAPENGIEDYEPKQIIIREMEIADCMYVVLEGSVDVSLRGEGIGGREVTIATLRPGDFFGEQALEENTTTGRRKATVRALQKSKLFRIDKKHVRMGLERSRDPEDDKTSLTSMTSLTLSTPQDREVRELLRSVRLFQSLTDAELSNVRHWTEVLEVGPGDFVLKETEHGNCMYVVLDGIVEIFTLDDDGKIVILAVHERGNYFGEQALMPGSTGERNAYARTQGPARLIKVPKEYFRLVLNRDSAVAQALLKLGQAQKKQRDEAHKRR